MIDVVSAAQGVSMHVTRGCLVVPVQGELRDDAVVALQASILRRLWETGVRGVVIDVGAVTIMDAFMARTIADTARMASLLGARTVITGFHPGIVSALIDLGFDGSDLLTAVSAEESLRLLEAGVGAHGEPVRIHRDR